jgi:histone acetyltransferase (RNA polymerase elongator complex component)
VSTVELGCQSFSDPVLRASGRGHVAADAAAAATILQQHGIALGIQLMPGLPGADREEAMASLVAALALTPEFLRVYPTVVLESTRLAELWRQGVYRPFELKVAIEVCADIELTCRSQGVPVARYGLQANEELNGGAVLAGPYHPAFGQLVKSCLWRRAFESVTGEGCVVARVHPADLSDAYGHRKSNLEFLESASGHPFVVETDASLARGTFAARNTVSSVAGVLTEH